MRFKLLPAAVAVAVAATVSLVDGTSTSLAVARFCNTCVWSIPQFACTHPLGDTPTRCCFGAFKRQLKLKYRHDTDTQKRTRGE